MLHYLKPLISPSPEGPIPSIRVFVWILSFFIPIFIILLRIEDLYKILLKLSYFIIIWKMAKVALLSFAFSTLILFVLKELETSRLFLGSLVFTSFSLVAFTRIIFLLYLNYKKKHGEFIERVILIGNETDFASFPPDIISKKKDNPYNVIVGYVSINNEIDTAKKEARFASLNHLGNIKDLKEILNNMPVDQVIWFSTKQNYDKFSEILKICEQTGTILRIINSYLFTRDADSIYACKNDFIGGLPSIYFEEVNWSVDKEIAKRALDFILSCIILFVLFPVLCLIAGLIKVTSPGPVFYRRQLLGRNGKHFISYKFRSMKKNADELLQNDKNLLAEYKNSLKIKDDPRITKIGKILRKTRLDELPQFINVLRGEMSIVGPRMLGDIEWNKYGEVKAKVLSVKPGITGLWQVSGGHKVTFEERARYDLYYINNWRISMDLRIILKTIPLLLRMKGK